MNFKKTSDLDRLKKLHKKAFPGEYVRNFEGDVCWLIYYRDKLAGFCSVKDLGDGSLFLSRAGVFVKGVGLHRRAIRHRLRWAKRNGFAWVVTYVHIENFKSIANLIRCRFELYTPEENYAGKGFLYFRKIL